MSDQHERFDDKKVVPSGASKSSAGEPMSALQVLMKIGSGPGQRVKITKKRTAPIVGDVLEIMPFPYQKYKKLERVRVTEIKDVGEPLYLAERW